MGGWLMGKAPNQQQAQQQQQPDMEPYSAADSAAARRETQHLTKEIVDNGPMGFWSKVKGFSRQVAKLVIEAVHRIPLFVGPSFWTGVAGWPTKKLRLHVIVLADEKGKPVIDQADPNDQQLWQALVDSINFVKSTFKSQLNVKVLPTTASRSSKS